MNSPYISRVQIKNFRNFSNVDLVLNHKQVIIGENGVGKTNFLKALQLILDPRLSDDDRYLKESDFCDVLESPMQNGEEIEISIEIRGYEHNRILLSQLQDASISDNPPTLRITYTYGPVIDDDGKIVRYEFNIYKANQIERVFSHTDRRYLNIGVINALRDVESDLKSGRKSPLGELIKGYNVAKEDLEYIATRLKETSDEVLGLDELIDLRKHINRSFLKLTGVQPDTDLSLDTLDFEPSRLLNTLKIMIGEKRRSIAYSSLGLNNILYISLVLLSLEDKTVPTFINKLKYQELQAKESKSILQRYYIKNENDNFILKDGLSPLDMNVLYRYIDQLSPVNQGFTILAIEEPEAHLHPTLQRLIYRDVINKSTTSVLLTTHSTHIASVAPIDSIVHLYRSNGESTSIRSSADIKLEKSEIKDVERYIDAIRGEIYFGKGVVLVEGIAEEYLVPQFAELINKPLDEFGIVVCNVNSTNFKPYMRLLSALGIPFVLITDGDYYYQESEKSDRVYHVIYDESHNIIGYLGNEIIGKTLVELDLIVDSDIPDDCQEQDNLFRKYGCYTGLYTFEVDIMSKSSNKAKDAIAKIFNELTNGGQQQQANFKTEIFERNYWSCLRKIEASANGIGKGRFAQRLSQVCTVDHIPDYVSKAILDIVEKVKGKSGTEEKD